MKSKLPAEPRTFAIEIRNLLMDNGVIVPFDHELLAELTSLIAARDFELTTCVEDRVGGTI